MVLANSAIHNRLVILLVIINFFTVVLDEADGLTTVTQKSDCFSDILTEISSNNGYARNNNFS